MANVSNFIYTPCKFLGDCVVRISIPNLIIRGNMAKTILAVLAHPDDESFGLGGTLALYAHKGYDTYLVCATRGEAGTVDPEHLNGFKNTAELRTVELERAAKI